MNRSQRAVKRQLKRIMSEKKREKRRALNDVKDVSFYDRDKKKAALATLSREEKGLKEWHRKLMNDYTSRTTPIKEEAVA